VRLRDLLARIVLGYALLGAVFEVVVVALLFFALRKI